MKRTIYLDNVAGTPLHPDVKNTMVEYLNSDFSFGNPVSQHHVGDHAAEALESARAEVAGLINAQPEEIVFTSSGTESINHAVKGVAFARKDAGKHIVTSNIEHNAVLGTLRMLRARGYHLTSLPVDQYGIVDPEDVRRAITDETILVSIMHANSEIGTIEPIKEIAQITRERNVAFHCDAVASTGVVPVDVEELGVDLLSFSANQYGGPSGIGALYIRPKTQIIPLLHGGSQENNRRGGTHNMVGIVGMGKAAELARKEMPVRIKHLRALKQTLLDGLHSIDEIVINGHPTESLPHLVSASVKYVEGESIMLMLDQEGVCISTRSACASGSLRASHVLLSIGLDHATAQGTLIFTLGVTNTRDDIIRSLEVLEKTVTFLRNMSPLYRRKAAS